MHGFTSGFSELKWNEPLSLLFSSCFLGSGEGLFNSPKRVEGGRQS